MPRKIRPPDSPIAIIRSVPDCYWCYKYTKWPQAERADFFTKCKEQCDLPEGPNRQKWLAIFDVLIKYDRKSLRKMVNNNSSMLAHCFRWDWFKGYQRWKIAERRGAFKAGV